MENIPTSNAVCRGRSNTGVTNPSIAASPDGIGVLTVDHFKALEWDGPGCLEVDGTKFLLEVLAIETAVANRALGAQLPPVEEYVAYVTVGDTVCATFVPREHMAQILLQILVSKFNFALYLCTGEAGFVSVTVVYCPIIILLELGIHLDSLPGMTLRWAHDGEGVPTYATEADTMTLESRLPFWKAVNSHVI